MKRLGGVLGRLEIILGRPGADLGPSRNRLKAGQEWYPTLDKVAKSAQEAGLCASWAVPEASEIRFS